MPVIFNNIFLNIPIIFHNISTRFLSTIIFSSIFPVFKRAQRRHTTFTYEILKRIETNRREWEKAKNELKAQPVHTKYNEC